MLISELDDEELQYVMGLEKLKKYTDRTLSTLDDLKKELKKIRSEQLSWDLGEQIPHNNCMAAPIRDSSRKIVAAVSLSALDFHMSVDELEKASVDLKEAANVISSAMGLGMT